nr:MAG TPA: hypothetical protein [Caudoviricetes sp.]
MSVHVGMKSANMLSCGSQRAEAPSPFKQRPPGITPWWLTNRYCVISHKTDLYINGQCRRVHNR